MADQGEIDAARKAFDFFDKDKSGVLDKAEFVAALTRGADPMSPEDAMRVFEEVDSDGSGAIDFGEYGAWLFGTSSSSVKAKRAGTIPTASEDTRITAALKERPPKCRDRSFAEYEEAFYRSRADQVSRTGNPWGITLSDVRGSLNAGNLEALVRKLELDVFWDRSGINFGAWRGPQGDQNGVEPWTNDKKYSVCAAQALYCRLSIAVDGKHAKMFKKRISRPRNPPPANSWTGGPMADGCGGGCAWVCMCGQTSNLFDSIKSAADTRLLAIGFDLDAYFTNKLSLDRDGQALIALGNRAPDRSPLRGDAYNLKFPTEQQFSQMPADEPYRNWCRYDSAMIRIQEVAAKLCHEQFQSKVRRIIDAVNARHGCHVTVAEASPKTYARMWGKLTSDHAAFAAPKCAGNVDTVRCGINCPLKFAVVTTQALQEGLGGVARVKNNFTLPNDKAALFYHYRSVLTNYVISFPDVTHGMVAARMRKDQEKSADPWDKYAVNRAADWLEQNHRSTPVELVCETQLILPEYLAGRKESHWPYKFVRCENAWQLKGDLATLSCDKWD